MSWFGIVVVFTIVWWMVFFITLPFGVTTPDVPEPGHAPSAPERPRLGLKALITTVVAAALTGAAAAAVQYEWISFRALFE